MKKLLCAIISILFLTCNVAYSQKGKEHDPNPTKDTDVQRGYDKHQQETKERRESEKREREEKQGKIPIDEVKKSHEGGKVPPPKP